MNAIYPPPIGYSNIQQHQAAYRSVPPTAIDFEAQEVYKLTVY